MPTLFIVNDAPYGLERSYNALRLAGALAKLPDQSVRVFLMGDATACAKDGQQVPSGYYNMNRMLASLVGRQCEIGVCGTCIDARGITSEELVPGARRSTLDELARWTADASKVIVF